MRSPDISDRAHGALLGLAAGDALGTTLEFTVRDSQPSHTEMIGSGPFNLAPGQWTDDTAMALALADNLVINRGFDAPDLMTRFTAWWREGTYSCTGACFDIGQTTAEALKRFARSGQPFAGSTNPRTAGNGSLMRLAPVALFALRDTDASLRIAREQSRTTHAAVDAVEACAFFVTLLREAILGQPSIWKPRSWPSSPKINDIAMGAWRSKTRAQIRSSGYVIDTLEAALWCVGQTGSFEDALVLAVNLGDDADTVGAVTGQLAGAIYGAGAIPKRWLVHLAWRERLAVIADELRRGRAA